MMGTCHHQFFDKVIFQCGHPTDTFSASVLASEIINGHPLDIAHAGHGNDCIFIFDQIFDRDLIVIDADLCPSVISVFIFDDKDLFFDHAKKDLSVSQDRLQLADTLHQLIVLVLQLLSFQTCQSSKTHIHNSLGLGVREIKAFHQFRLGILHIGRVADDLDHFVDVVKGDKQSFKNVGALLRLIELVFCAPCHHFFLMLQIVVQHIEKIHNFRLIVYQCQHDDTKSILKLGMFVELV